VPTAAGTATKPGSAKHANRPPTSQSATSARAAASRTPAPSAAVNCRVAQAKPLRASGTICGHGQQQITAAVETVDVAAARLDEAQQALDEARNALDAQLAAAGWRRSGGVYGPNVRLYENRAHPGSLLKLDDVLAAIEAQRRALA
jgi:hypothetical protein